MGMGGLIRTQHVCTYIHTYMLCKTQRSFFCIHRYIHICISTYINIYISIFKHIPLFQQVVKVIGSEIISASQHGNQVTPPPILYLFFFFVCHELIHLCSQHGMQVTAPSLHHVPLFFECVLFGDCIVRPCFKFVYLRAR